MERHQKILETEITEVKRIISGFEDEEDTKDESDGGMSIVEQLGHAAEQLETELATQKRSGEYFEKQLEEHKSNPLNCSLMCESNADTITCCGHAYCEDCIRSVMRTSGNIASETYLQDGGKPCPICRTPIDHTRIFNLFDSSGEGVYGAKVEALISDLRDFGNNRSEKSVLIVVEFKDVFRLLKQSLSENGIATTTFTGRSDAIDRSLKEIRAKKDEARIVMMLHSQISPGMYLGEFDRVIIYHPATKPGVLKEALALARGKDTDQLKIIHYVVEDLERPTQLCDK